MADIIKLENRTKINQRMLKIFKRISKYIDTGKCDVFVEDYYANLVDKFNVIHQNLKNDKYSISLNLDFLNKFKKSTNIKDKNDRHLAQLRYVMLYDEIGKDFLKLSEEYIKMIVSHNYMIDEIDEYKEIIKYITNPIIKKDIDKEDNYEKRFTCFSNYVDCILNGDDPFILANSGESNIKKSNDDKTINEQLDEVKKECIEYSKYDKKLTEEMEKLKKITEIKLFTEIAKTKFLELIDYIKSQEMNDEEKVVAVSSLVDLFIYFVDRQEDFEKMDTGILKALLSFKIASQIPKEEAIQIYEDYKRSRGL